MDDGKERPVVVYISIINYPFSIRDFNKQKGQPIIPVDLLLLKLLTDYIVILSFNNFPSLLNNKFFFCISLFST